MIKFITFLFVYIVLRPLIVEDYAARKRGDKPDEWFWADKLCVYHLGYFVSPKGAVQKFNTAIVDRVNHGST